MRPRALVIVQPRLRPRASRPQLKRDPLGGKRAEPEEQLKPVLALAVTLPVFVGVLAAAYFGATKGLAVFWACLALFALGGVLWWGLQTSDASFAQRFVAPLAVYVPPFGVAGAILHARGRSQWSRRFVVPVAAFVSVANLFLAQVFFAAGCAAELWVCP